MNKSVFYCFLLFTFLISCSDSDDNIAAPSDNLPVEIVTCYEGIDGDRLTAITYTGKLITRIKTTDMATGNILSEVKIGYSSGKPVKVSVAYSPLSSSASHTIDISYTEDHIAATYSNGTLYYMTADELGKVLTIDTHNFKTTFKYDDNGNIIGTDGDRNYTYDGNPGIFSQTETPQWLLVACLGNYIIPYCTGNNYLESYYDTDKLYESFQYRYNQNGYPRAASSSLGAGVEGYPLQIKSISYK